jgi:hypothetical protein
VDALGLGFVGEGEGITTIITIGASKGFAESYQLCARLPMRREAQALGVASCRDA